MKNTRDRIVTAAYECFSEKGYEQTTIRMILERSGAATGSFYHFFASKDELFEAVVDRFLTDYVSAFEAICGNRGLPPMQRCQLLFEELARRRREYYGPLGGAHLHWSMVYGLHEKTIVSLLPSVELLLTDAVKAGTVKSRLDVDVKTLSILLIRGMEAILHGGEGQSGEPDNTERLLSKYMEYMNLLLEITPEP